MFAGQDDGSAFERLAFETAVRSLDKQEKLLEELRARTGLLLATASLSAALLGQQGLRDPDPVSVALIAMAAFVVSILTSVYILYPKKGLVFTESGRGLYEGLYAFRGDLPEVYRRLAYDLQRFWDSNDRTMVGLMRAYAIAALALVIEIVGLMTLLSGKVL